MTRRYGDLILVAQQHEEIRCFMWRGTTYRVKAVLAMWHLRDRWWEPKTQGPTQVSRSAESDRHYFRLDCSPSLLCELYYDTASDSWTLDRVYD